MRDKIIQVLTMLATFFGRVPGIGPIIMLLLALVTQFWPEMEALIKRLPRHLVAAVERDSRPLIGAKTADDPVVALVRACKAIGEGDD